MSPYPPRSFNFFSNIHVIFSRKILRKTVACEQRSIFRLWKNFRWALTRDRTWRMTQLRELHSSTTEAATSAGDELTPLARDGLSFLYCCPHNLFFQKAFPPSISLPTRLFFGLSFASLFFLCQPAVRQEAVLSWSGPHAQEVLDSAWTT